MKFVALVSGGKDSCYNVVKCLSYGHELVCLANLSPPDNFDGEEMNSFMYQTAAHGTIPMMSQCFGVPLLRRSILGSSLDQGLIYEGSNSKDEVEDLFLLLQDVIRDYPEVEAVSVGAIISNYQRLRVENVCDRLNLTVLCYLWEKDRKSLLLEIVENYVDAILVKVAGAGLDPDKHLGKSLAHLYPTIMRLHEKFGLDPCGEGGEFETLVLDCAAFKEKIVINKTELLRDEEDYSVGNLKIVSCINVMKDDYKSIPLKNSNLDLIRTLLSLISNERFKSFNNDIIENIETDTQFLLDFGNSKVMSDLLNSKKDIRFSSGVGGLYQSELILPNNIVKETGDNVQIAQNQVLNIFTRLKESLLKLFSKEKEEKLLLSDVFFVHLYLSDLNMFVPINRIYCQFFGTCPPSRSCLQVDLPTGVFVALDIQLLHGSYVNSIPLKARTQNTIREVLHVQGRSEWAPQCIGPYSQANSIHQSLIFVAGQIPLDPATMLLLEPENIEELTNPTQFPLLSLALCLRHADRVITSMGSSSRGSVCCTVYINKSHSHFTMWDNHDFYKLTNQVENMTKNLLNCGVEQSIVDQEDVESLTLSSCSVLVVYMPQLPKGSIVEVEIIAARSQKGGIDMFKFPFSHILHKQIQIDTSDSMGFQNPHHSDTWEIWNNNSGSFIKAVQEEMYDDKDINMNMMGLVDIFCSFLPRSYCFGIISMKKGTNDLITLQNLIILSLRKLINAAELSTLNLSCLRLYYIQDYFSFDCLTLKAFIESIILGIEIPIIVLPVPLIKSGVFMEIQVIGVDLVQINTENWIYC